LNYLRTVSVVFDGTRWQFTATGTEAFEEVDAYQARRVRDRFTSAMLERYGQALGIEVFDPSFYGPDAVLVESAVPMPPDAMVMTLRQAQEWLKIAPGMADSLPSWSPACRVGSYGRQPCQQRQMMWVQFNAEPEGGVFPWQGWPRPADLQPTFRDRRLQGKPAELDSLVQDH
jgi:hypothetical protein